MCTRISDVGRRTIRWSAGRRRGRRETGLFPFPRASLGSFSTPALGRGRRRRQVVRPDQSRRPVAACLFRSLARPVAISSALQLYINPFIVRASRLSSLSSPCFTPPRWDRLGTSLLAPYHTIPFLHPPRCHRPTLTQASDVPFQSIVFGLPHRWCEAAISGAPY